jgi:hypothetical protein
MSPLSLEQSTRKLSSDKQLMPYGMGTLKIPLQSIHSMEGSHYCLGAKRKEAVRRQATINPIHEFGYPLVIPYPGCTA